MSVLYLDSSALLKFVAAEPVDVDRRILAAAAERAYLEVSAPD